MLPAALKLLELRFQLKAKAPLHFPAWKAGNFFRGTFGITLKRLSCAVSCSGPMECTNRQQCAYANLFEPVSKAAPSGFANPPRPFVFRVEQLNGSHFQPDDVFSVRMHLFGNVEALPWIEKTLASFERMELMWMEVIPVNIALLGRPCQEVTVEFITPLELKSQHQVLRQPDFPALISRIRDRIAALSLFYGEGAPPWDYKQISEKAGRIKMVHCDVQVVDIDRQSSRTGQIHGLGGFVGSAHYEGMLDDLLPLLMAAEWTGVGRHTAWGNGAIRLGSRHTSTLGF